MRNDAADDARTPEEANRDYFLTLAKGRFSLDGLSGTSFVTAMMLALAVIPLTAMVFSHGQQMFEPWLIAHCTLIGGSLLLCLLATAKSWVFRFQVLSTSALMCLVAAGWVYACCLLALWMASTVSDGSGGAIISIPRLRALGIGGLLFLLGALGVHVILLRRRLCLGHSRERAMGNLGVPMRASRLRFGLIAVAAVFTAVNAATRGEYLLLTTGSACFILLASVTPSLVVELTYLIHLKARDRDYWDTAPGRRAFTVRDVVGGLKKIGKWFLIVVGVVIALVLLGNLSL